MSTVVGESGVSAGDLPGRHRFTADEYFRIGEQGLFDGKRVELIDGVIVDMAPQGHLHIVAVTKTLLQLQDAYGRGFWIRPQSSFELAGDSVPEPDAAVVRGGVETHAQPPASALLFVEVSDATLKYDLRTKARLYATAGVPEYWVIDVNARRVIVHRSPAGGTYADVATFDESASLRPPEAGADVVVRDLLP